MYSVSAKPYAFVLRTYNNKGQALSQPFNVSRADFLDVEWYSDEIISTRVYLSHDRCYSFYRAESGRYLYGWVAPTVGSMDRVHQPASYSPNKRWGLFDQGNISDGHFSLYDFENEKEYVLLKNSYDDGTLNSLAPQPWQSVEPVGWASDNSLVYLLSYSLHSPPIPNPRLPLGLLAFNPETHAVKVIAKDALQLEWSPDHQWAFIVSRYDSDPSMRINGLLLNSTTQSIVASTVISPPAFDRLPQLDERQKPIAWSHDGKQVAVAEPSGRLIVMDVSGVITELASDLPLSYWERAKLEWSPDDKHLLLYAMSSYGVGDKPAWVINIP